MSKPLSKDEILYSQRACGLCGLYDGAMNGVWSNVLDTAEHQYQAKSDALRAQFGTYDPRSEKNIVTLILPAQELARNFMKIATAQFSFKVSILSGTRTYAEQNALYAQGRTAPGKIVTNARGGQSNHNFGLAWDVGIFEAGGRYMTGSKASDNKAYADLAALVKPQLAGLEWGGDWKAIKDAPHYQLNVGASGVKEMRGIFEAGKPLGA